MFLTGYPKSFAISSNSVLNVNQDSQNIFDQISSYKMRYGDYQITMYTQTSTTATSSEKIFTQYIKIAEFEPWANFWAYSAYTVPKTFSASNASIAGQLTSVGAVPNASKVGGDGTCFEFVSGYAPNLTVYFVDSSEAHTFPISSYHWNFGDPFNEGPVDVTSLSSNYYTVTSQLVAGNFNSDPVCWQTIKQGHTAVHTYIMPGTYDVTLTVRASTTSMSDTCARYIPTSNNGTKFYVYVEEIMPQCNGAIRGSLTSNGGYTSAVSAISGVLPVTSYFMASGIIAGSFPICRIDWDFGDGTIERITRRPLTSGTSQSLPLISMSAYSYDLLDPRNFIVPHIYQATIEHPQTYNVVISAYACNTNTMITCSALSLVHVTPTPIVLREETKRLIGNRFDENGNLIYVLEGQSSNTTHTVLLTGEI
jgi:hypothetical protein